MDQFHNYHHWRPRPPSQANVCPVCSAPHFPYCPQFPPYSHQSPNFPSRPHFPGIGFESYSPPPPATHHQYPHGGPSPWQVNSGEYHGGGGDGDGDGGAVAAGTDRSFKRPRVDEIDGGGPPGLSGFGYESYQSPNPARTSSENERRLKLIHDHGGGFTVSATPPPGNPGMYDFEEPSVSGSVDRKRPFPDRMNQYVQSDYRNGIHYRGPASPRYGVYLGRASGQPPLPTSQRPTLPVHPPIHPPCSEFIANTAPPKTSFSSFSFSGNSSSVDNPSYPQVPNAPTLKQLSSGKPRVIEASHLFKLPHRALRPDRFVIILRGLPGSGKSYMAKMLRDIEVENGGNAPRVHSIDDYFMTEVEKVEENDGSTSSSSGRIKKPVVKKVMEYCYEPELEEAYRSSMLKAFKRTLEEGVYPFVIVDDRNLRVADFAQFWATAKRSDYEVYILEATYKDPVGCAARNVHGFSLEEIQKMAGQWEEAPSLYIQLDVKSLSRGDQLKESGILEVDMDMEDDFGMQESKPENTGPLSVEELTEGKKLSDPSKDENRWDAEGINDTDEVRELSRSKWSNLEDDDSEKPQKMKGNSNTVSGLIYRKEGKSVRWGDEGGDIGFSIGGAKNSNSLVIGPGAGYTLKSNPLSEKETLALADSIEKAKMKSVFQDQLRAERESFRAVFDRRKQRIGRFGLEEE